MQSWMIAGVAFVAGGIVTWIAALIILIARYRAILKVRDAYGELVAHYYRINRLAELEPDEAMINRGFAALDRICAREDQYRR